MKNASFYQKKVKRLLRGMKKYPSDPPEGPDPIAVTIESVLQADASDKQAAQAMDAIRTEYVDFNEFRVSPIKEIVECLGRGFPRARRKAEILRAALRGIFDRTCRLSLEFLAKKPKKEIRRQLLELGLDPFSAARMMLMVFGGHAAPVDETLVECLEMGKSIYPGSDLQDVQGFLERIIPQKNAIPAHCCLREFVAKSAKALARKRKAEEAARKKAEEAARKEAEAAERKRAAEAEAAEKAKAEAAARKAKRAKAKKPATKRVKKKAKKSVRKKAKKAARPRAAAAKAKK